MKKTPIYEIPYTENKKSFFLSYGIINKMVWRVDYLLHRYRELVDGIRTDLADLPKDPWIPATDENVPPVIKPKAMAEPKPFNLSILRPAHIITSHMESLTYIWEIRYKGKILPTSQINPENTIIKVIPQSFTDGFIYATAKLVDGFGGDSGWSETIKIKAVDHSSPKIIGREWLDKPLEFGNCELINITVDGQFDLTLTTTRLGLKIEKLGPETFQVCLPDSLEDEVIYFTVEGADGDYTDTFYFGDLFTKNIRVNWTWDIDQLNNEILGGFPAHRDGDFILQNNPGFPIYDTNIILGQNTFTRFNIKTRTKEITNFRHYDNTDFNTMYLGGGITKGEITGGDFPHSYYYSISINPDITKTKFTVTKLNELLEVVFAKDFSGDMCSIDSTNAIRIEYNKETERVMIFTNSDSGNYITVSVLDQSLKPITHNKIAGFKSDTMDNFQYGKYLYMPVRTPGDENHFIKIDSESGYIVDGVKIGEIFNAQVNFDIDGSGVVCGQFQSGDIKELVFFTIDKDLNIIKKPISLDHNKILQRDIKVTAIAPSPEGYLITWHCDGAPPLMGISELDRDFKPLRELKIDWANSETSLESTDILFYDEEDHQVYFKVIKKFASEFRLYVDMPYPITDYFDSGVAYEQMNGYRMSKVKVLTTKDDTTDYGINYFKPIIVFDQTQANAYNVITVTFADKTLTPSLILEAITNGVEVAKISDNQFKVRYDSRYDADVDFRINIGGIYEVKFRQKFLANKLIAVYEGDSLSKIGNTCGSF